MNYFILEELPIPSSGNLQKTRAALSRAILRLNVPNPIFAPVWLASYQLRSTAWGTNWALADSQRKRLRSIIEATLAEIYGLEYEELQWMLRIDPSDPKGFWRVDKDKPVELRQTTLTLLAFKRLKEVGLEEFLAEDWQFPKEIAQRLGPLYLDWQKPNATEEEIKQSWEDCEMHARNMLGEDGFRKFMLELKAGNTERATSSENPIQVGKQGKLI